METQQAKGTNLAVDVRMINSSGIGVYLKNILPRIIGDFRVSLLGDPGELAAFDWAAGGEIIPFTASIYSLGEQMKFPGVVPAVDLLWCPHFNVPLLPVRARRILTTIHDANHLAHREGTSFFKWRYAKLLYDNAVRRSHRVITMSVFSKEELLRLTSVEPGKLEVVYNGVDTRAFSGSRSPRPAGLPENYLLYVGNIKPHKNLIALLKAYAGLPKAVQETYHVVILGKKEGFITPDREIFGFIEAQGLDGKLHFTGYLPDAEVPAVYQHATLFVFPSLYEGFGLPPLEAMASGVPVLCSNASSLPEVGGDAVAYFDPRDPSGLRVKIEYLLKHPEERRLLIEKGAEQANRFTWEASAKAHRDIIHTEMTAISR